MVTIEDTADNMFKSNIKLRNILSTVREIKSVIDMFTQIKSKSENTADVQNAVKDYSFSGQHTDIAFIDENGSVSINDINNISDDNLRSCVSSSYNDAVKDGYVNYANNQFTLTDKGREHINSEAFKNQFRKDQLQALSKDKAQIRLKGNQSDLNVFRYCDSININKLSYSNPSEFKRVVSYFEQCQKYDFVHISPDGTVTPTDKCFKYFEQNKSFSFDVQRLTPDNIVDFAKYSKKAQQTSKAAQTASQEAAKRASQELAKKAVQEGAKKAAQATAKAATAAASGAATAGIGTAVTAVIDIAAKGIKELDKSTDIHRHTTPTLQNRK